VADRLAGCAAAGVVAALGVGGRWMLDVSMAGVAAHVAGVDWSAPWLPTPGCTGHAVGCAIEVALVLGADNARVAAEARPRPR
jgi:hypothetical protein